MSFSTEFISYILQQHDAFIAKHSRFSFYQGWPKDALILMGICLLAWILFAIGLTRIWIADLIWAIWPFLHGLLILSRMTVHLTQKQWVILATLLFWGIRLSSRIILKRRDVDWKFNDLKEILRGSKLATIVVALPVLFWGKMFFLYVGCLSLYTLIANDFFLVRPLFLLGITLQLSGIVLETASDEELDLFQSSEEAQFGGGVLSKRYWKYCRHPNYLGQCLFWIGLWISTGCELGPSLAGPIVMVLHFYFISVPRLEDHILDSSPVKAAAYAEYRWLVPSTIFPFGKLFRKGLPPAATISTTVIPTSTNKVIGKNNKNTGNTTISSGGGNVKLVKKKPQNVSTTTTNTNNNNRSSSSSSSSSSSNNNNNDEDDNNTNDDEDETKKTR
jgi:steroid 5-alpha reductase family enzyme